MLVVADLANGRVEQVEHRAVGTRLGEGLREAGMLGEAAMQRTLVAVRAFVLAARMHDAVLCSLATSALRRAENADDFASAVRDLTGVPLQIIDGQQEAAASFRGAVYADAANADDARAIAVLDIGGGSTECALGSAGILQRSLSLEIGTVRLTEAFPALNGGAPHARARASAALARVSALDILAPLRDFIPVDELRAVAGTPATIAAIALGTDVDHAGGKILRCEHVWAVLDCLLDATFEQRCAMPGMVAQRADLLAAGAILLQAAMELLACAYARVELNDLLLGYLVSA